jgi:hypothetical protein
VRRGSLRACVERTECPPFECSTACKAPSSKIPDRKAVRANRRKVRRPWQDRQMLFARSLVTP